MTAHFARHLRQIIPARRLAAAAAAGVLALWPGTAAVAQEQEAQPLVAKITALKGIVQVRQPLLDIAEGTKDDGTPCCLLIFKNELVPVRPVPRRAFQGWRYLDPDEAPEDLKRGSSDIVAMPPKLRKQLDELGLL